MSNQNEIERLKAQVASLKRTRVPVSKVELSEPEFNISFDKGGHGLSGERNEYYVEKDFGGPEYIIDAKKHTIEKRDAMGSNGSEN